MIIEKDNLNHEMNTATYNLPVLSARGTVKTERYTSQVRDFINGDKVVEACISETAGDDIIHLRAVYSRFGELGKNFKLSFVEVFYADTDHYPDQIFTNANDVGYEGAALMFSLLATLYNHYSPNYARFIHHETKKQIQTLAAWVTVFIYKEGFIPTTEDINKFAVTEWKWKPEHE